MFRCYINLLYTLLFRPQIMSGSQYAVISGWGVEKRLAKHYTLFTGMFGIYLSV